MRIRKTFSYETRDDTPDVAKQIEKLQSMKNGPYWNRSFADTAGMVLSLYLEVEIAKYEHNMPRKEV